MMVLPYTAVGKIFSMTRISILIVGGSGYVGRFLRKYLSEQGADVTVVGRTDFDIFSLDQMKSYLTKSSFDLIIYLAASVKGFRRDDEFEELFRTNVSGLYNFFSVLRECKKIPIIYFSSVSVYGDRIGVQIEESTQSEPMNPYGLSKALAEDVCRYFSRFQPVLVLRIPGLFGGGRNAGAIASIFRNVLADQKIELNLSGLVSWESLYIDDLGNWLSKLISVRNWDSSFEIMNVGYSEPQSFEFIIDRIFAVTGKTVSFELINNTNKLFCMSSEKLQQVTGYRPTLIGALERFHRELK